MTKSEFRAKSAKKLFFTCIILLFSNILTGFNAEINLRSTRLAESATAVAVFALIAASVLTALSVRSERKWTRRFDEKKYMKAGTVLFVFISATVIISLLRIRLSLNTTEEDSRLFLLLYNITAPFSVVFSFSVIVGVFAAFYAFSTEYGMVFKLLSFVTAAFAALNMLLRLVYTCVSSFAPYSALLNTRLLSGYLRTGLSVLTYLFGAIIFFWARSCFLRTASTEKETYNKIYIKENGKQRSERPAIAPPPPEGFGIDREDELPLPEEPCGDEGDGEEPFSRQSEETEQND